MPGLRRFLRTAVAALLAAVAGAHDFIVVRAAVVVDGETVSVTLLIDQGDLLIGLGQRRLAFRDLREIEEAHGSIADYLQRGVRLAGDGEPVALAYSGCIEAMTATAAAKTVPTQVTLLMRGTLGPSVERLAFEADILGEHQAPLIATVHFRADARDWTRTVGRGEAVEFSLRATPVAEHRAWWNWIAIGFRHIIPDGLDHILFVIGLAIAAVRWRPLLWQITAFTVAHSLTLALTILDFWTVDSDLIEPLIAASIAAVAIENIIVREPRWWRWIVVFIFGLVHGMGFAGALREYMPPEGTTLALTLLNAGVELGQLTVIAVVAGLTAWWSGNRWYRRLAVVPVSIAIAAIGIYWAIDRAWSVVSAGSDPPAFTIANPESNSSIRL
ncbi:MAG TPA: HupE/UreJ family protein [Planctomycetota bacterium]|nr:HupE/UreJ family protein [Planctomycetota bacterium]